LEPRPRREAAPLPSSGSRDSIADQLNRAELNRILGGRRGQAR
jgi:hypothetical protein